MDHPGFLADIIEHPEDDVPRLIYADWLDEQGDTLRAGLIRWQIETGCTFTYDGRRWRRQGRLPERSVNKANLFQALNVFLMQSVPRPFTVVRGFVEAVECSCNRWLAEGPELVRQHPLRTVRLSDCRPYKAYQGDTRVRWSEFWRRPRWGPDERDRVAHELPKEWFTQLRGLSPGYWHYDSEEDAQTDLSRVCLAWAWSVQPKESTLCGV